jgi:hypothetical protein
MLVMGLNNLSRSQRAASLATMLPVFVLANSLAPDRLQVVHHLPVKLKNKV